MSNLKLAFRWLGAILLAFIVYLAVFGAGAVIWQHFGTNPRDTIQWSLAAATTLAMIAAGSVVARHQWRWAALTIWILALLLPAWGVLENALSGRFDLVDFVALLGTLSGGLLGYYALRVGMSGRKINRVAGQSS